MPALNVEFSDDELAALRAAAAEDGKSLKSYVHDLAVRERQRRAFVAGAAQFVARNRAEFDHAFPEDSAPGARSTAA